jgi:hypothetical protein
MLFGVVEVGSGADESRSVFEAASGGVTEGTECGGFCRVEAGLLPGFDLGSGDFDELVGAGVTHQNGDFVVGGVAASGGDEVLNGTIALLATLAVFGEELLGDAADLEAQVAPFGIRAVVDLVTEGTDVACQGVAVNLGEIGAAFIDRIGLQGFPALFGAVPGEIGSDGMGVELGIEFATRVVVVDGEKQITGGAVVVSAPATNARGSVRFQLG